MFVERSYEGFDTESRSYPSDITEKCYYRLFDNCYFQSTQGDNPFKWFTDYPEFTNQNDMSKATACVASSWSSPHFRDCTLENSQYGYRFFHMQGVVNQEHILKILTLFVMHYLNLYCT